MLARLRELLQRLGPDPARTGLGWWLAAINVAIVLLVALAISLSAVGLLRDLADEQGQARAQLAGAVAREELRKTSEDLLTSSRVLAERPTLLRLLSQERHSEISPFLRRFCTTGGMDACAVLENGQLVAQSGSELPWHEIATAAAEQGERFMATGDGPDFPVLGAVARLEERPRARVYAVRRFGSELARMLSEHVGLDVRLVNYHGFTTAPADEITPVHSAALADGGSAVQRIEALDAYVSSVPVFAPTGEAIAFIETRLPADAVDTSASRLIRRLIITAVIVAALALFAGMVLGRLVAGPVQALTAAATRLGQGDFSTSIPPGGPAEVGALARTMEEMRRSLIALTSALRQREAEAQAVLSGIVEGVYAVDKDRIIRYLNPQAARLLGVDPKDAVGRFCGDVLKPQAQHGRRPCETNCPILRARSAGTAQGVEGLQATGNTPRTTVITSSNLVDGLQVQVIRDETELEAARRARDSILANISHEFRTPLAAQLASIELLREGLKTMPPEQQMELVRTLERGTVRLTQLIDNLLESVRIESGQLSIRRQSIRLHEIVDDARSLIGSLLTLRNQKLDVTLPEELPEFEGDGPRLTQVFVNLLANASKFAPEGSTIHIGADNDEQHVNVWVEDEGEGLPPGEREAVFERFRRGAGEEPEPGGLGLGLWIVKSIIARHGGTISVERTPQERTRFQITLPLEVTA